MAVIRHQAKVAVDSQYIATTSLSQEPVAGTNGRTTESANAASTKNNNQGDKGVNNGAVMAGLRERVQVGEQTMSKTLSKAQINVVSTMVYITVCFTLCWMPLYFNVMFKKLMVSHIKYVLAVSYILQNAHVHAFRA